jgi:hypothetical protein
MRRSYFCVLLLVGLFASIHLSGCGGGGSARLMVRTTSLPDGNVGVPYTATLVATGGTPGYTWSQVSGGDMPAGVSLGSSGIFNGTPRAAGNFGPYVFNATDSSGAVAASAGLSITINATTLSVLTTSLPNGTVNSSYSVTLAAVGGAAPYTWTQTSGGTLPPGLANITNGGVIAGIPTTAGSYGPYVFTATDSAKATAASVNLTITIVSAVSGLCAPLGNEAALTSMSPYAFLVKGTDGSGKPVDIAGSFTPDGAGGIINATVDFNGFSAGPEQLQVNVGASSYAFGTTTLGCLSLTFTGTGASATSVNHVGSAPAMARASVRLKSPREHAAVPNAVASVSSVQFTFALGGFDGSLYHTGRIIESDTLSSGTNATGFIYLQLPSAFSTASLESNYVFGIDGWTAEANGFLRTAIAGAFTNTSGALSAGYTDINTGGVASGELIGGAGTLNTAIDATTGRGTGTYKIPTHSGNLVFDFAFYILNGTDFILLSIDSTITAGSAPLLCGRALASSATNVTPALNGYYILEAQGLVVDGSSVGNLAEIGTLSATSAGTIPTTTLYVNRAGAYAAAPYFAGSYTVESASGRAAIAGITTAPPVVYLTVGNASDDGIVGFLVGTDPDASSGLLIFQSTSAPAYLTSDISGSYATSTEEDLDALNGTSVGAFSFTGSGQYTSTQMTTGAVPDLASSGLIAINSDGSGNLNGGSFPLVTNRTEIFVIPSSGDPLLYVFTAGTVPD